jgi:phosphatidylserine/phosphatidylglycerophosphate/cardiolipin synthase-like enzyme
MADGPAFTTCDADSQVIDKLRSAERDRIPQVPGPAASDAAATARWFQGVPLIHTIGNSIVPYIYGRCAFADMADALGTATDSRHRIYMIGWWTDPSTRLKDGPGQLLRDYLSSTKAAIRGMFWDDPGGTSIFGPQQKVADNGPIVALLNGLPNGAAILDHKLPFFRFGGQQTGVRGGVHHQKLLVVSGSSGLIAFTGGMDINPSRVLVSAGGFEPLHDVHVRVIGPESAKVLNVFRERWLDHEDSPKLDLAKFNMAAFEVSQDFDAVAKGRSDSTFPTSTRKLGSKNDAFHAVAIGRTYAKLRKFNSGTNKESYSFAPNGEETAWRLIQNAIQRSSTFIYIEDQYLVSRRLKAELVTKLRDPKFQFVLILMQDSGTFEKNKDNFFDNEIPYLIAARNEIRTDFLSVDPKRTKWRMFRLKASADPKRQQFCGSYVHSKTLIFDDDFAVTGTANAGDRGYSYDTEVVAGVTDDPFGRATAQRFARNLRVNLWHKHLAVSQNSLIDWKSALRFWFNPPSQAMIVDSSDLEDSPMLGGKAILRDFSQANRLWQEDIDPDADLLP